MGKLKDLAMVKSASASNFAYLPPDAAFDAMRILVKPYLALAGKPSAKVSLSVLDAVLRGLRRASPMGRIVVIDTVVSDKSTDDVFEEQGLSELLDREMRLTDSSNLINHPYKNRLPDPYHYSFMEASEYIKDYDCVISLGAFAGNSGDGKTGVQAALHNLISIFPRDIYGDDFEKLDVDGLHKDVYFTIGHYFHGAVVDFSETSAGKVVWGDDLLAVDEVACQIAGETIPDIIKDIRQLRKQLDS